VIRYERDAHRWVAVAEVRVGVGRVSVRLELGELPHEPDAGGLRGVPVIAVASPALAFARAGAERAGKMPAVLILPASAPRIGGQFLVAVEQGADVILVEDRGADALAAARALAGTPILPAPSEGPSPLDELAVDVTIAVPNLAEGGPGLPPDPSWAGGPGWWHHPITVDPRPAFEHLERDPTDATPGELAAAAAGVLAGRIAAGNRRWRS